MSGTARGDGASWVGNVFLFGGLETISLGSSSGTSPQSQAACCKVSHVLGSGA